MLIKCGLSSTIGQAIGQSVGNTVAPSITLNPANSGLGVYAIGADGVSQPLNGSNTINGSQDGNDNINFKLQESWLNG